MKKLSQLAAVIALGTACAMPVMAQDTSTTTQSTATPSTSTQTMGAGPEATDTRPADHDRDMGWIGLLGLAGLLGLRGRKHHDDHIDARRTTTAR